MNFTLTPKQALAYLLLTQNKILKEIGYGGAAGGGKSFLGCFWIISMAQNYPGTSWLIGRKELTNLKKTTLISFFKVLDSLDKKPQDILTMNSQTNIIYFNNGSKIFLMDMANQPTDPLYTRFGGLELTGAFIDESNENDLQAIEIIKTRIGRCKNDEYDITPKLLETFNPSKSHVYYRYYEPFKKNQMPVHRTFIKALATDNKYLPAVYIEQLNNADKITKERLLYGNFEYDDDPARLFEYDRILEMFDRYVPPGKNNRAITVDVARFGQDRTVIIFWNGLMIEKIYSFKEQNLRETKEFIIRLMNEHNVPVNRIIIDEDGVGGGLVDELVGCKGFVNNSKQIQLSDNQFKQTNFANLKSQCYFCLADYVNQGRIGIKCDNLEIKNLIIQDLEQMKRKDADKDGRLQVTPKEDIKASIGRSPDFGDAIMMRMLFEVKPAYHPILI
jgi:hypothetical protein